MKQIFETNLSVHECLELLHATENAHEGFAVRKKGNEFRVWRKLRWYELFWKPSIELPILNGILVSKSFTTQIEVELFSSAVNGIIPIAKLIIGLGVFLYAFYLIAFNQAIDSGGRVSINCLLGCLLAPVLLTAGIFELFRMRRIQEQEQPLILDFVTRTLRAKPITL